MNMISIISLGALCLIMAVLNIFFGERKNWQGLLVRGLAIASCIALVQVCASLKSLSNVLPLFVTLGLVILVLVEALKFADAENEKSNVIARTALAAVGFVLIACAGISLSEFNIFALLGGVAFGVAFGLIVCAIKKYKLPAQIFSEIFFFMSVGLILGFALMGIITSTHMISAICLLGGGIVLLFQKFMYVLGKGGKALVNLANFLYVVALTAISLSIYFY